MSFNFGIKRNKAHSQGNNKKSETSIQLTKGRELGNLLAVDEDVCQEVQLIIKIKDMKKVLPLGENVLVEVLTQEKMTKMGIVLPDTVDGEKPQEGIVIAVGESEKISEKIQKGCQVLFAKYSGSEIEIDKKEYLILKSKDILAVITD